MTTQIIGGKKPCIWMEAGVIDFKICNKDFDCANCELDRAMSEAAADNVARRQADLQPRAKTASAVPWEERMHQRFGEQQKCQLMQTRHCHQCSFDELLAFSKDRKLYSRS
jgi:hypothetical protein